MTLLTMITPAGAYATAIELAKHRDAEQKPQSGQRPAKRRIRLPFFGVLALKRPV